MTSKCEERWLKALLELRRALYAANSAKRDVARERGVKLARDYYTVKSDKAASARLYPTKESREQLAALLRALDEVDAGTHIGNA